MIILTQSFLQKEFKQVKKHYTIEDIKKSIEKIDTSADTLSDLGYKNGKLMKLRVANKVSGRLVVYVFVKTNLVVPVVVRLKKDKIFGENLSMENKKAKALIVKMLDLAIVDIENGNYKKVV